jgi:hypothetical protein
MDAGGNGKSSGNGRREEDERDRVLTHGGQGSGENNGDRRFNPACNGPLRYNLGHNMGRAYRGYARGWQRQQHPGYHFAGSRMNDRARVMPSSVLNAQRNNHPQTQRVGEEGGDQSQKGSQATPTEPQAPEVFKN